MTVAAEWYMQGLKHWWKMGEPGQSTKDEEPQQQQEGPARLVSWTNYLLAYLPQTLLTFLR